MKAVAIDGTLADWKEKSRALIAAEIPPTGVSFTSATDEQSSLDLGSASLSTEKTRPFSVPRAFVELAEWVSYHRDERKWDLLYRVLFRLLHGEPELMQIDSDPDIVALNTMRKNITRDRHKMTAFVRFRQMPGRENEFAAWYEPDHRIVPLTAPFFARRFATMKWTIFTPDATAHWDGEKLSISEGVPEAPPSEDALEDLWTTYYASVFNPARVKVRAMKREMPVRFWKNLPETDQIASLLAKKAERVDDMLKEKGLSAANFIPADSGSIPNLREAARACEGCHLHRNATQTVFGYGPETASIVLIGEQPGDEEDQKGLPFVGPAGRVLREICDEIELPIQDCYVTNAVKHFSWKPQGKRRLHQKPRDGEIAACQPWLVREMSIVQPKVVVCLGATAGRSVFGRIVRIEKERGEWMRSPFSDHTLITFHPSAILRAFDDNARDEMRKKLAADLKKAASHVG